jgi:ankyrin repeat protein
MVRWVLTIAVLVSTAAYAQTKDDVEAVDSSGWTALMRAAEDGKTAEITALLARGAKLEASNPKVYWGATPVVIALEYSQHDAATLLLDRGASVAGQTGIAALELAARSGFDDLVDRLLAAKVSPKGTRAVHLAAMFGHVSTIKKLVKAGAAVRSPNKADHSYTPFIVACQNRQVEAARTLLELGADVNDIDADGTPALHWAVFGERPNEIHIYAELGGPHDTVYQPHKDAPLVKLLVDNGAKLDTIDHDGNTALHEAAIMDAAAAAQVLLAAGADRTKKNHDGKTAYDLANHRDNSVAPILRQRPR